MLYHSIYIKCPEKAKLDKDMYRVMGYMKNFCTSSQFCCVPKAILKPRLLEKKVNGTIGSQYLKPNTRESSWMMNDLFPSLHRIHQQVLLISSSKYIFSP